MTPGYRSTGRLCKPAHRGLNRQVEHVRSSTRADGSRYRRRQQAVGRRAAHRRNLCSNDCLAYGNPDGQINRVIPHRRHDTAGHRQLGPGHHPGPAGHRRAEALSPAAGRSIRDYATLIAVLAERRAFFRRSGIARPNWSALVRPPASISRCYLVGGRIHPQPAAPGRTLRPRPAAIPDPVHRG